MDHMSVYDVAKAVEMFISERGQTKNSVANYHYILSVFIQFCNDHNAGVYSEKIGARCLDEHYGISDVDAKIDHKQRHRRTAVRVFHMMTSVSNGEQIRSRYTPIRSPIVTANTFQDAISRFQAYHTKYDYSQKTIENYSKVANSFLVYAEQNSITNFDEITPQLVFDYVQTLSKFTKITIKHHICALRIFLRFLYIEGYHRKNLDDVVKPLKCRSQTKIPSVWQKEEVLKMLSAIDRGNPGGKRDYAMLLLVTRLGLRISDVNNLKFENLNWSKKIINIVQHKTNEALTLPLLSDVGWALIDYIKNARPKVDSPYVFVTHVVPYKEFSMHNHHHELIIKYLGWAGLPVECKRKLGMHSLRHTLATIMLENHEDYHNISAIIGHSDIDSTKVYLKTSIDLLRECTLPIPEVT